MRFKNVGPVLLLCGVALSLFAPYLIHPGWLIWPRSGLGADIVHLAWPDLVTFTGALSKGALQLWNDSTVVGHPMAGDLGTLWLYPLAAVFLVLPPALAFTCLAALHVFLAGLFTYFLVRALFPVSRLAATVSALTFMLTPKMVAHLAGGHVGMMYGLTWLPAVLLGARVSMRSRRLPTGGLRLWPAAWGGLALALQLPGHPQIVIGTLYLLAGMMGWHCWQTLARAGWRSRAWLDTVKRVITVMVVLGGVAATVGAVWWIPVAELLRWTAKIEFEASVPFWYQIPWSMLPSLFAPTEFQFPEWTIYVGTLPLFLALIALLGERRREAIYLWAAAGVTLFVALGNATPVYALARWLVPGLSFFRTRTRLWLFGGFAIALLAGWGTDALRSEETWARVGRHRRWFNLAAAAYVIAGVVAGLGLGFLTRRVPVELLQALGVGALSLILFWIGGRHLHSAHWVQPVALVAILLLDLFPIATAFMTGIEPAKTFLKPDAVMEFVASQPGDYRVYSPHRNLSYALAVERGVESIDGLLNLQLAHAVEIVKVAAGCQLTGYASGVPPCLSGEMDLQAYRTARPDPAILGLLNVRYVVSDFPLDVRDLTPVLGAGGITVYENRRFLPRAFLVDQVQVARPGSTIFQQLAEIDPARTALVEPGVMLGLPGGPVEGEATIESRAPGHIRLTTRSNREVLLVYSQTWAPGWRATIDEHPAQVVRVDGALLGLVIPAGARHITFDYLPVGWQISWPISLLALVALVVGAGVHYHAPIAMPKELL